MTTHHAPFQDSVGHDFALTPWRSLASAGPPDCGAREKGVWVLCSKLGVGVREHRAPWLLLPQAESSHPQSLQSLTYCGSCSGLLWSVPDAALATRGVGAGGESGRQVLGHQGVGCDPRVVPPLEALYTLTGEVPPRHPDV